MTYGDKPTGNLLDNLTSQKRAGLFIRTSATTIGIALIVTTIPVQAQTTTPTAVAVAQSTDTPASDASPKNDAQVEDIVVTAQRREERLQSVPVAISAFSAATIQAAGITDTASLQNITPGLVVSKTLAATAPFIRGIGSSDVGPSSEASVAIYLDGIYLVAAPSALFGLSNIERIEVLKGPQGTLFGRNSTGGLIQIITRAPGDKLNGRAEISYGNYDTVSGNAYIGGGLGKGFALDLAASGTHQGKGWGRNLFDGSEVGLTSEYGGRIKLTWSGPNTEVALAALYNDRDSDNGVLIQPYRGGGAGRVAGNIGYDQVGAYNINAQQKPVGRSKTFIPSLTISQDLGFATLRSLTSYQYSTSRSIFGPDAVPLQLSDADLKLNSDAGTQELQLLSGSDSSIKWIVGAFGLVRNGSYDPAISYVPPGKIDTFATQITHSYSAYGQVTIPVLQNTNITGGLRYTRDEQKGRVFRTFNGAAIGPESQDQIAFSTPTWRVSVDHQATPDILLYASYNRGYKSGLFNLLNYPLSAGRARPETVDAFEAGFKSDLFDRRLRFNASTFLYSYRDLQVFFFLDGSAFTLNADKARIFGAEAEFTAKPMADLTIRGGATYLGEAKYIRFDTAQISVPLPGGGDSITTGSIAGARAARSPKLAGNLGIDYELITPVGTLDLNTTASYQGKYFWMPEARLFQPGYVLINAQAKVHVTDDAWVSLWARNLTNKYYYVLGQSLQTGDIGSPGAPRNYGVSIGSTF